MRNWVHWLIDHNMRWVVYGFLVISFPVVAMFGFWLECYEDYFYTWKSVKNAEKAKK